MKVLKKLRKKEEEIIKYLTKNKEGDFMTKIAFAIGSNSVYTLNYLKTLRRYKLIEKVRFGKFHYWRLRQADDKN